MHPLCCIDDVSVFIHCLEWECIGSLRNRSSGMYNPFFLIERECIEFIYCQFYPATRGVISDTLPLWKKEWQYTGSSQDELGNTPHLGNLHHSALDIALRICPRSISRASWCKLPQGRIFQHIPPLGCLLLQYIPCWKSIFL